MIDWQALRDTTGTLSLLKVAAELGLHQKQCLASTHIEVEKLEQPFYSLKVWQELALLRNIQELSKHHPQGQTYRLGLVAANHYGITDLGLLGLGMQSCNTLGEALSYPAKYQAFGLSFSHISLQEHHNQLAIVMEDAAVPSDCQDFCRGRGLAVFRCWSQQLINDKKHTDLIRPIKLELRLDKPKNSRDIEQYFDCPVEFSAAENRLFFDKAMMQIPLPSANLRSRLICDHYSEEFRQQLSRSSSFEFKVCEMIQQLGYNPSAETIATALDISERRLRRQLADSGNSLRQCIFETRMRQACIEVKKNKSIEAVAQELGYQDKTSFSRAFKAYTGTSPGKYLK